MTENKEKLSELDQLKKELEQNAVKLTDSTLLFMDLSSNCTGYSICSVNFETKRAEFKSAGAIWFNPNWSNQEKYHYLYRAITTYFDICHKVDACVAEAYMVNSKKLCGSHIGPELHGVLQVSLEEVGIKYHNVLVQTWRKELGIKPITDISKGKPKRDFKEPTKLKVLEYVSVPEKIISNITHGERTTPTDLFDALGVGLGFLKKIGIKSFGFSKIQFQEHVNFNLDKE